jgi:hypothetical protein
MDAPLISIYDLSDLSEAGADVTLSTTEEQRTKLAQWAGVDAVEAFVARVTLQRRSANRFAYDAKLMADILQSCVVTLDPVHSHLDVTVERSLHLVKVPSSAQISPHELSPGTEEGAEEIQDPRYDIAGPVLEEFALAIDPYPRAPGVVFEAPADSRPPESPFAALKSLKTGD